MRQRIEWRLTREGRTWVATAHCASQVEALAAYASTSLLRLVRPVAAFQRQWDR